MANDKERVALGSIAASAGLTLAKTVVGLLSGSLAILSEAAHSLLDLAATVITYFAVRISGKPADREHQYGHGKVESVAALAETALLFLLSAGVIWEAVQRLLGAHGTAVEATIASFAVIAISIVVDFFRARVLSRTAAKTSSQALEADALHFSSDMWSSLAVLVGLCAVALGFPQADSIAAIVVAMFVCLAGWRLGKRTIDTLTDTAPSGVAERVAAIARKIRGIVALDDETVLDRVMVIARNRGLAVHHVMVHEVSGKLLVALDLEVDGQLSLGAAHDIASALEAAIAEELGTEVEVDTHIEPMQPYGQGGRDASGERVAAVRAALADVARKVGPVGDIHDVRVRETPAGEIVNFHCLVDPALSVDDVHAKVDEVERGLKARWPSIKRVIGHAEPRR